MSDEIKPTEREVFLLKTLGQWQENSAKSRIVLGEPETIVMKTKEELHKLLDDIITILAEIDSEVRDVEKWRTAHFDIVAIREGIKELKRWIM